MSFVFEERPSDSSLVERIWRTHSEQACTFTSLATSHWEMVITKHQGNVTLTVRGPETKATSAPCPADAEFFGIQFKLGTFIPILPTVDRVNGGTDLPEASSKAFWFNGSAWQFPNYENADTFVNRLVRNSLLVREPIVEAALEGQLKELSLRSVQRRFLRATGLTHSTVRQIERARQAAVLLEEGSSILDVVEQAGYADQPHLTRALKYFIGQTPAQLSGKNKAEWASPLFTTLEQFGKPSSLAA